MKTKGRTIVALGTMTMMLCMGFLPVMPAVGGEQWVQTAESDFGGGVAQPDDSDTGSSSGSDSVEFVPSALFITLIVLLTALVFTVRQNPGRRR